MTRSLQVPWRRAMILASLGALVFAAPVGAADAKTTKGAFHTFAAGVALGLHVSGTAVMVRTETRTLVVVMASGLTPDTVYGSHVHKQSCAEGDADGHFQFTPGGAADSVNEIWPGFGTDRWGIGIGFGQNAGVADATAVSVVIHAPGGAKVACADLR